MLKEFKAFIMRGNVLELAVAVIVAGAFGGVVASFTNDIILPPLGLLLGDVDFSALAITLKEATADTEAVELRYGKFIQSIIDFVIIAFAIFMVLKAYNNMQKKKEEAPAAPPAPSNEEKLLAEIRDLLKK
jgi:large conductance mechanosensitive channel